MTTYSAGDYESALQAAGVQATSGNSSEMDTVGVSIFDMVVSVTSCSGTVSSFRMYVEGTIDNGSTWTELPFDLVLKKGASGVGTAGTNQRDLIGETTSISSAVYWGRMMHPPDQTRVLWVIAGTQTPTETFSIQTLMRRYGY